MSITVATVALNAAADLPLTLESVLHQDHEDLEIIVLDGASWDGTAEVLERYRDVVDHIAVVEDSGIYDAMNRAAAMATKDFILFMNAGDRFHTARSLSKLWGRRRAAADIVFGNHIYRDGAIDTFRPAGDFGSQFEALRAGAITARWVERFPAHQATMTRTALLRGLRYDTAWRLSADHDFLLRAVQGGAHAQYVDEIVAIYVGGGLSARLGALCRLEWNAIYRGFSERPSCIDTYFHGEDSPFAGTPSPCSGGIVGGLGVSPGATGPAALASVGRDGLRCRTPVHVAVDALTLRGCNETRGRRLAVTPDGGATVAIALPTGDFAVEATFDPPLAPCTLLRVVPVDPGDDEPGALMVARDGAAFWPVVSVAPSSKGVPIALNAASPRAVDAHLARGWWPAEADHVWTEGCDALIRVACKEAVSGIALTVRANPVMAGQTVTVTINDELAGDYPAGAGEPRTIEVVAGAAWRGAGAVNRVRLAASCAGPVGADRRTLGIAILSMALS